MSWRRVINGAVLVFLVVLIIGGPAGAANGEVRALPGFDCTESPTPDMPGTGVATFFDSPPSRLPAQADPFAKHPTTTIYEQYGYTGLRWHTYDLGCGPDMARNPDAVIGTAVSNWIVTIPVAFSALTSSVTRAAMHPTFMDVFDPAITRISSALHDSLFASWVPLVVALLGLSILLAARRHALATTAGAIGWALMVVLVATAVFRWPLVAGHFADDSVTTTLGSVVSRINGSTSSVDPGTAVASNVQESIFYKSWLAGTLGSTETATARKYGPTLYKAQALTWREAAVVQKDPSGAGKQMIEAKKDQWSTTADKIKSEDPTAYEYLTGQRSDTRFGYAVLAFVAAFLALPFLLVAALMLLGSFLIVRLAVMMFPAFATIGVFPAGRGIVLGVGRTVGAALVNSIIFGIGAAITIRVLGLILDPASRIPGWLALVLLPLFGFVMWVALKPFRRLTAMVSRDANPFGEAASSVGQATRNGRHTVARVSGQAIATYVGGVGAGATVAAMQEPDEQVPDRAEARPATAPPATPVPEGPKALPPAPSVTSPHPPAPGDGPGGPGGVRLPDVSRDGRWEPEAGAEPLPPVEPEWIDGEEVYQVFRPPTENADDAA